MSKKNPPPAYPTAPPANASYPQASGYPTQYPQPLYQTSYPYQQPYAPTSMTHPTSGAPGAPPPYEASAQGPPPPYSAYPNQGPQIPQTSYPQPQPATIVHQNLYDGGARFDGIAQPSIPPPPPGVAPNAAQMATAQGQTVVGTQERTSWLTGPKNDGGWTWGGIF